MEIMRLQLWIFMIGIVSVYADQLFNHISNPVRGDDISDKILNKDRGTRNRIPFGPATGPGVSMSGTNMFSPEPSSPRPAPIRVSPETPSWCPRYTIKLNFSHMSMGRFEENVIENANVISLNLSHNSIKHIPANSFIHLPMLVVLDLSANEIPVPELLQLKNLGRLEELFLDDNHCPRVLGSASCGLENTEGARLPNLRNLQLRGNSISDFTISLREFAPSLTHLSLSRNKISSTEFLADLPPSLTHLDLDENSISRMESDNLAGLNELSMNRNDLEVVCLYSCSEDSLQLEAIRGLKDLRLSGNKISRLVLGSSTRKHYRFFLRHLDLSHNRLTEIPSNIIPELHGLKELALGYNRFTQIPDLCGLNLLQSLDLSWNEIKTVPYKSFCDIGLHELNLSNNKITMIEPSGFNTVGKALSLNLANNQLSALPLGWIQGPVTIRILRLQNNTVADFRNLALDQMMNLEELHITGNPLTHLTVASVRMLSPNLRVYFHDGKGYGTAVVTEDDSDNDISE